MKIYDRASGAYFEEEQYGGGALRFLYETIPGRLLLKGVTHPLVSKIAGLYYRHPLSKGKIDPFIRCRGIDEGEYERRVYRSFDDFFVRKRLPDRQVLCSDPNRLIAPADSKLLAYEILEDKQLPVKRSLYSLEDLLADRELAERYRGGKALIFRLSVDDYHRYVFAEGGEIVGGKKIDGRLHTVSSFSEAYPVYVQNSREYIVIRSERGGDIVQMEVGALLVGRIENHPISRAVRGAEKGFFRFGGSTIILLTERGRLLLDEDILRQNAQGIETRLRLGEGIGEWQC